MIFLRNILVLSAIILSSCMNPDSNLPKSAGKWVGEGDYNGKAFQLGSDKDMGLVMKLIKAYNSLDVDAYNALNTDELNENMNITSWFEEMDSLSWVPFVVVPMHLETGEHRVVHVWSNEFRRWKNGSTQKVELMEVFGIKDDKIDWFRQWNRNNSENEFGLRSGGKYFGREESEYMGRSLVFSNRGEVEILEKLFKDYNNMDGDSIKLAFADTVVFRAADGSKSDLVAENWLRLFDSTDSVSWTPISMVPLKIENTDPTSGALVLSNEVRHYKDGTVFNKDLVELFYFNLDRKISGINQWSRDTEVDKSEFTLDGPEVDLIKKTVKHFAKGELSDYRSCFTEDATFTHNQWGNGNAQSIDELVKIHQAAKDQRVGDIKILNEIYEAVTVANGTKYAHAWVEFSSVDTSGQDFVNTVFVSWGFENDKLAWEWAIYNTSDSPEPYKE